MGASRAAAAGQLTGFATNGGPAGGASLCRALATPRSACE